MPTKPNNLAKSNRASDSSRSVPTSGTKVLEAKLAQAGAGTVKPQIRRLGRGLSGLIGVEVSVAVPVDVPVREPIAFNSSAYAEELASRGDADASETDVNITPIKVKSSGAEPATLKSAASQVASSQVASSQVASSQVASSEVASSEVAAVQPVQAVQPVEPVQSDEPASTIRAGGVVMLLISAIVPSPFQPRREMDEVSLQRLAESIARAGVMQPIIVRRRADGVFELVVGERRWRAAKRAGLETVPAIVRELDDETAAEWALIENVQREDLNAMDRAWALKTLCDRFVLTHLEIADRLSMERSSVANLIRLTELEESIARLLAKGLLSTGHGKALLTMPSSVVRELTAKQAAAEGWTVRKLEAVSRDRAKRIAAGRGIPDLDGSEDEVETSPRHAVLRDLERQIGHQLGTKVVIAADKKGTKGRVTIEFYGLDHFEGLLGRMGIKTT